MVVLRSSSRDLIRGSDGVSCGGGRLCHAHGVDGFDKIGHGQIFFVGMVAAENACQPTEYFSAEGDDRSKVPDGCGGIHQGHKCATFGDVCA